MPSAQVSERILARFRTISSERLTRIELAWTSVTRGGDRKLEAELLRDIHTLKGDARVVGLDDVALLCQKLEDLVFAAQRKDYAVSEEIDLLVMMAIQFGQMYVRAQRATKMDLAGFARQIDEALAELEDHAPSSAPSATIKIDTGVPSGTRAETPAGLNVAATMVFLEHLRAEGAARFRLRQAWEILSREVREREAQPIAPVLTRDVSAAADLAQKIGKEVELHVDLGELRASAAVIEALHVAMLHGLRNALDHGIEMPAERVAAGKKAQGKIRVSAFSQDEDLILTIEDDGRGIDLAKVRAAAEKRGLLNAEAARTATTESLIELLFVPGFTTKEQADAVSGRGIGMDAVREVIARIGGKLDLVTSSGAGSKLVIRVPGVTSSSHALCFVAPDTDIEFALPPGFEIVKDGSKDATRINPFALSGLDAPRGVLPRENPVYCVRDGSRSFTITCADPPVRRPIVRRHPTPETERTEIVESENREIVMLRPF